MATSREMKHWWLTLGGAVLILAASLYILGVEDSSSAPAGRARQLAGGERRSAKTQPSEFSWLRPGRPPEGWHLARLPAGTATLAYPPSWRAVESDAGSVSAVLIEHRQIRGYLNATPRSGEETLRNWRHFRPAHNRDEGDRNVVSDGAASGLRFRSGIGSCVVDHYATVSAHYKEIACIVRGPRSTTVVVGAARSRDWADLYPLLERSIASFAS